ncbi:MAG: DUF1214 domain-containing protein [Gammaproteobacteria bacterium]
MAYGDSPHDEALRREWHAFCERLKAAGDRVFKDGNPANSLQRADGFRYLTQNLSQAFDLALETKDTKYPAIHAFCAWNRKLGSDNADCVYLQAWIDGESVYRISGRKGDARFWNICVQGPRPATDVYDGLPMRNLHEPFGDTPEANIFGHELKTEWDGSFVLWIGGPKREPNWLPTTPGTRKLYLRQYFDRWDEAAAEYRIERVGMDAPRPMPTHETIIEAVRWASDFVYDAVDFWPDWPWEKKTSVDPRAVNRFSQGLGVMAKSDAEEQDTRRGRTFTQMYWKLAPEEAIVFEFDWYDGFFMITNEGMFGNSMDFLYRNVSYTPSRTAVDPDGKVRFVLSHRDPGYHNWIDTQAYETGHLTFRNVMTRGTPELRTRVVKFDELQGAMHAGSRRVSAQERTALLWERFNALRRRYRI